MPYEPFLISDMRMGLELGREPWISPPGAWREMKNAYVFRGRIWKRSGYSWFGELGTPTGEALGHIGVDTFTDTLANIPVVRQQGTDWQTGYSVKLDDSAVYTGANAIHDMGDGLLYVGATAYGTIDYETGDIACTNLPLGNIGGTGLIAAHEFMDPAPSQNAVMGIDSFFPRSGGETLFAWDRKHMWKWNASEERFEQEISANIWSSDLENFFWIENFYAIDIAGNDGMLICNGVDILYYWNGTALKEMHTSWSTPAVAPPAPGAAPGGGYTREIESAVMSFLFKNRCVLLSTIESGSNYPQRARWSDVAPLFTEVASGNISWDIADYADAPTADWIVSAAFLGDDLIVFFERSVWKLRWKDDFQSPFEWEHMFDTDGSFATMSTVDFSNDLVTLGATGLIATDGIDVVQATPQTPDIALDWNPAAFQYTFGIVVEEGRQSLFSFAASGEDYPQNCLVQQYDDDAISTYTFPFHCYGYFQFEQSPVWDDYPEDWDVYEFAWDERTFQAGFPAVLAGDRNLRVFTLWSDLTDWNPDPAEEGNISMRILSNRLNPYLAQNLRCRLGFLNIYASTNASVTLKVTLYGDFTGQAYLIKNITLDGPGTKVKKRIPVFIDKNFHQVQIEETGGKLLRIDGIEMEAMATGRMRTI
jgi:hypothetical protein